MEPYREHVAYFLLDTHHADLWGGTGKPFDWQQAHALTTDFPILLAGGINIDNVEEAICTVQPIGVDLSSSLEEAPGRKDFDKLTAFFDVFNDLREDLLEDSI
jgi:phosphoribosylanthranilate isomerase